MTGPSPIRAGKSNTHEALPTTGLPQRRGARSGGLTFVVRRILRWQEEGIDIDQQMLALSTYVGHANVTNTYWYLSAVPELLARAAARFEPLMGDMEVDHV